MLKYLEFIKESKEKYLIHDVDFGITRQELEYALFEITDVFTELDTRIDGGISSSIIEPDTNTFIITLDNYDSTETDDNYRDITYIEPKIRDCIKYFQDKMNYYGLDVLAHDFAWASDTEYEIVVGKKGHKITTRGVF
jgi:hypothetical protein|tara:strand:- start:205 stop:618 length:414 start_codon:yes stop_codon:yes gene_type:complete